LKGEDVQIDVDALMEGELGQWLTEQTSMREKAKQRSFSRYMWSGGAYVFALIVLWISDSLSGPFQFFLTAAGAIGVGVWGYLPIAEASKTIKIGINSAIAKTFGLSYEDEVEPGSEFRAAQTYKLIPGYNRKTLEDRWFGELEGHDFSVYEAHLEERRGSGKNKRWVTVFRGAIITMQFGRPFQSTTLLQRAGKHRSWFGFGGSKDEVSFSGHRLARVEQVHPKFEDVFDLYSDDGVEARVLTHPAYVEHLLAVEGAFEGDAVRALFQRGSVLIVVETGRLFESGAINAAGDRERVEEAARQFGSLAGLALAINQNDRGRAIGEAGSGPSPYEATGKKTFGRKR
jgi:hypothetical protein